MTTQNTAETGAASGATSEGKTEMAPPAKAEAKQEAPKSEQKAEPKSTTGAEAKNEPKQEAPKKPEAAQLGEEDDDIPDNAELLQLSKSALTKRLQRHTKKELREHFGTDDPGEIKSKLEKFAEYEAKAEEERRKQLTREQQLQEDLEREKRRAEKAERDLQNTVDRQTFAEYDAVAKSVFDKYFDDDEDTRDFVAARLKKHVFAMDDKEAPSDPKKAEKVFDAWAKEYAKKHPKYAKKAPEPEKPEPKKIALNTGTAPTKPERGNPDVATKTPRPGQANSMSKAEYAEWKRRHGISA